MVQDLRRQPVQGMMTGASSSTIAKSVGKTLQGKTSDALRPVPTEMAAAKAQADYEAMKTAGIEEYELPAVLDSRTSNICQDLDQKHFLLSEKEIGVNYPPLHPNCRTVAVAYFNDDIQKEINSGRAARDPETGKTVMVEDLSYRKWKEKYVTPDTVTPTVVVTGKKDTQKSEVRKRAEHAGIEYREVRKSKKERSVRKIIRAIGGNDKTKGSCSSLAFAYAGNRGGYEVYDFRGGKSAEFFSMFSEVQRVAEIDGVKATITQHRNDLIAVEKLLSGIKENIGKEYYLATGKHAAIVRVVENGFEYLELQFPHWTTKRKNGFKKLNNDVLIDRFECQTSYFEYGLTHEAKSLIIDVDSLMNNEEFIKLLGYINTDKKAQVKGAGGYVR